ncbi:SLC13 family permease [Micromonospora sp. B11E3]|uniref:SLC13 family permease n=1 Tax=Micromonospora sp. B11E3 TaxID=3153562 RepID=UPI00325E9771
MGGQHRRPHGPVPQQAVDHPDGHGDARRPLLGSTPHQATGGGDDATDGRLLPASMVLLWGSAALSAIVDNIPYVATMSPVVADLAHAQGGAEQSRVLWWALALGADLGGNATAVGASANVVVLGLAERAGQRITFWQFTRYGILVTLVTVGLAVPYLWLRYFVSA